MASLARTIMHGLAGSRRLQTLASRYGLRKEHGFARRFVAGERAADAIDTARRLSAAGLSQSLAYLGADAATLAEADAATRACIRMLGEIADAGIDRHLSLSLTHYGLLVDRATSVDSLRRLLDAAGRQGFFVYLDMEESRHVETTFEIFETLWQQQYRNAGLAVQAYLLRSAADVGRLNALGARVRLVKGSFREPRRVAYQSKALVDAAYIEIMQQLLVEGSLPAFATHDPAMIAAAVQFAGKHGIPRDRFEFHLLHGIRRDLQAALAADGYTVRVLVPFGPEWFPYLMRRLGERPANMGFVVRSLVQERQRRGRE